MPRFLLARDLRVIGRRGSATREVNGGDGGKLTGCAEEHPSNIMHPLAAEPHLPAHPTTLRCPAADCQTQRKPRDGEDACAPKGECSACPLNLLLPSDHGATDPSLP